MKHLLGSLLVLLLSIPARAQNSEPIKLGASLALSGKLAFIGKAQLQGLQLAVDEINDSGGVSGRKIQLVAEDNGSEPRLAVAAASKLLNADKVKLLYSGLTHLSQPIKGLVAEKGALMIYGGAARDIASAGPYIFRDWDDAPASGAFIANSLPKLGKKRVVILSEINDACAEHDDSLIAVAKQLGIEVAGFERFNSGESDFRSILFRLIQQKPDALLLCAWRDSGAIVKQLNSIGQINLQVIHTLGPFVPSSDTSDIRELYERNRSLSQWFGLAPEDPRGAAREFVRAYRKRFGELPTNLAALTYDDANIIAAAAKACGGKEDPECLASRMKIIELKGVSGTLRFNEERLATRQSYYIEVRSGIWRRVEGHGEQPD